MGQAQVNFELTTRCNLACRHCLRDRSDAVDLDFSVYSKVLEDLKTYGIDKVGYTGGEPLVYPHFQEAVELAVKKDFRFALVTNGLKLPDFAPLLAQPDIREKLERICISFEGPDEETNDRVRGKGTFKKAMKGLLAVKARNLPFSIKIAINSFNKERIGEMTMFASQLGAVELQLSQLHITPESLAAGLPVPPEQWTQIREKVEQIAQMFKIPVTMTILDHYTDAFPLCTSLSMADYYIDAHGWLSICCTLPSMAGVGKGEARPESLADMRKVSFAAAHRKLIAAIHRIQIKRIKRIEQGRMSELEHYPCLACCFYLDKLKWLKDFPDSPWCQLLKEAEAK